jgi:hypothetical protein
MPRTAAGEAKEEGAMKRQLVNQLCLGAAFSIWAAFAGAAAARSAADETLVVPGKSAGKVELGMRPGEVIMALGAPSTRTPERFEYRDRDGKLLFRIFFTDRAVVQIEFTSADLRTREKLSTRHFRKFPSSFRRARLQRQFLNLRYSLKEGGLTFYALNYDSTSERHEPQTIGVVHAGAEPPFDPVGAGGEAGWAER